MQIRSISFNFTTIKKFHSRDSLRFKIKMFGLALPGSQKHAETIVTMTTSKDFFRTANNKLYVTTNTSAYFKFVTSSFSCSSSFLTEFSIPA